eukprot:PhF_6_TR5602/c0_g1_i1/m.8066
MVSSPWKTAAEWLVWLEASASNGLEESVNILGNGIHRWYPRKRIFFRINHFLLLPLLQACINQKKPRLLARKDFFSRKSLPMNKRTKSNGVLNWTICSNPEPPRLHLKNSMRR